jgi:hypothetical protein
MRFRRNCAMQGAMQLIGALRTALDAAVNAALNAAVGVAVAALAWLSGDPALADPAALGPQNQIETFVIQDDNVDRGPGAGVNRSDQIYGLHVSRDWSRTEGEHTQLAVTADGGAEVFGHHDKLDHVTASAAARWNYRASGEFDAATYGIFLRALANGYESDLRSDVGYALGLRANGALTDRMSGDASISGEQRRAQNAVFSGTDWSLKGHLDYAISPADVLYLNGIYRRGDTTLSGIASFENPKTAGGFIDVADDAFTADHLRVYRMHARTTVAQLGFNHAFGANASLDLSWLDAVARPTAGTPFLDNIPTRYIDRQWTADFVLRF